MSPIYTNTSDLPVWLLEALAESTYPNDIHNGSGDILIKVGEGRRQISIEPVYDADMERAKKLAEAETNFLILRKQARK